MCILLCDYRPISSVRGGLLLASASKEIKGYINAARPFISLLSAAHCPSPLSDEVERFNNPMRETRMHTLNVKTATRESAEQFKSMNASATVLQMVMNVWILFLRSFLRLLLII
jgi:hypothetical protein